MATTGLGKLIHLPSHPAANDSNERVVHPVPAKVGTGAASSKASVTGESNQQQHAAADVADNAGMLISTGNCADFMATVSKDEASVVIWRMNSKLTVILTNIFWC